MLTSREIVRRAIEMRCPPRLPFWQHGAAGAPDDVADVWEMDRARAGWFFDRPAMDDWGCAWARTDRPNMGQVVGHPLASAAALARYRPPDPRDPYYFERIGPLLDQAGERYVVVTCHFNLIERLHMLRGFVPAMTGFHHEPCVNEHTLDLILDFKLAQLDELHRRFGSRVDGIFLTDDWGTQHGCFIGADLFEAFFAPRYARLFGAIHDRGWHVHLHSCGRINALVPRLIELGADVLNMQQPRAYGLVEFGAAFRGRVCFLTTVDIQATLPRGDEQEIRQEARLLVRHWSTPAGGFIVFNYGDGGAIGTDPATSRIMFEEFARLARYWQDAGAEAAPA